MQKMIFDVHYLKDKSFPNVYCNLIGIDPQTRGDTDYDNFSNLLIFESDKSTNDKRCWYIVRGANSRFDIYLEDIIGDLNNIKNSKIRDVYVTSRNMSELSQCSHNPYLATILTISTNKGCVSFLYLVAPGDSLEIEYFEINSNP